MSLIQVNDLSFSYDGSYEPVFDHVSFQIDTNWKLGFTGRNGRGKTTFLRLLLGGVSLSGDDLRKRAVFLFSFFREASGVLGDRGRGGDESDV